MDQLEHPIERYRIDFPDGRWMGYAYIDENTGHLFCTTDWGHFPGHWTSRGDKSLKEFLVKINDGYVEDKLSYWAAWMQDRPRDHFYLDETIEELKEMVIELRKPGWKRKDGPHKYDSTELDAGEARECWEHIDHIRGCEPHSVEAYHNFMWNGALSKYIFTEPHGIPCVTGSCPGLRGFMKNFWPKFKETITKELEDGKRDSLSKESPKTKEAACGTHSSV